MHVIVFICAFMLAQKAGEHDVPDRRILEELHLRFDLLSGSPTATELRLLALRPSEHCGRSLECGTQSLAIRFAYGEMILKTPTQWC